MITRIIARFTPTFVSLPTRSIINISPIRLRHEPRLLLPSIIQPHYSRRTFAAKTDADETLEKLQELSAAFPSPGQCQLLKWND